MALGPLMIDIAGTVLTPADRDLLSEPAVGGVILFKRNFESISQLIELNQQIKSLRGPELLIAVDQEGGRVQRFGSPFTALPPLGWFGLLYDQQPDRALELARQVGWLLATELLAAGVDFSFTPVLDLQHGVSAVIGDRALHRDPEVVIALATRLMQGLREGGVISVGKHFPGHGAVVADSHLELPTDRREYDAMYDDIRVFDRMARVGMQAIMTAHVVYSALDSLPASFSRWWQTDTLRGRFGFRGAIISDDLSMKATLAYGSIEARCNLALEAGSDLVLICNDRPMAERAVTHLAGHKNPVSMSRLARLRGTPVLSAADLASSESWLGARRALDEALGRESEAVAW